MGLIGKEMKKWPSDALWRVCDAPVERWASGALYAPDPVCLLGHAIRSMPDLCFAYDRLGGNRVGVRFDWMVLRFGIPRVVRACKQRALRILEQRGEIERTEPARVVAEIKTGT